MHTHTQYGIPRAQTVWHGARRGPEKSLYRNVWHLAPRSTVLLFTTRHTQSVIRESAGSQGWISWLSGREGTGGLVISKRLRAIKVLLVCLISRDIIVFLRPPMLSNLRQRGTGITHTVLMAGFQAYLHLRGCIQCRWICIYQKSCSTSHSSLVGYEYLMSAHCLSYWMVTWRQRRFVSSKWI